MQQEAVKQVLRPEMLTVTEVAKVLHVHRNSVRRWADMGLLRAYRFGVRGDRRFKTNEVDEFLESAVEFSGNGA